MRGQDLGKSAWPQENLGGGVAHGRCLDDAGRGRDARSLHAGGLGCVHSVLEHAWHAWPVSAGWADECRAGLARLTFSLIHLFFNTFPI
jgi:hypothetical protein